MKITAPIAISIGPQGSLQSLGQFIQFSAGGSQIPLPQIPGGIVVVVVGSVVVVVMEG